MSKKPTKRGDVTQGSQKHTESQESQRTTPTPAHASHAADDEERRRIHLLATFKQELEEGTPSTLELCHYIQAAILHHQDHREDWMSPLWPFVRTLTGHPEMNGRTPEHALQQVEINMGSWPSPQGKRCRWRHYFDLSAEGGRIDFITTWDTVRYPPGHSPLANAMQKASKKPLLPTRCYSPIYGQFISIAGWLQVTMGDRNILLPCHSLAPLLEVEPRTISRYRQLAVKDKLLIPEKTHRFKSGGGGAATEFRFDVTRFGPLQERQQKSSDGDDD